MPQRASPRPVRLLHRVRPLARATDLRACPQAFHQRAASDHLQIQPNQDHAAPQACDRKRVSCQERYPANLHQTPPDKLRSEPHEHLRTTASKRSLSTMQSVQKNAQGFASVHDQLTDRPLPDRRSVHEISVALQTLKHPIRRRP